MQISKIRYNQLLHSISESLLSKTISFTQKRTSISGDILHIIKHSRRSLLFHGKAAWQKSSGPKFDVTMGFFDGAEVCELVNLHHLSKALGTYTVGLYRHDGLAILRTTSLDRNRTHPKKRNPNLSKFWAKNHGGSKPHLNRLSTCSPQFQLRKIFALTRNPTINRYTSMPNLTTLRQ